jgi:hypothetical protein
MWALPSLARVLITRVGDFNPHIGEDRLHQLLRPRRYPVALQLQETCAFLQAIRRAPWRFTVKTMNMKSALLPIVAGIVAVTLYDRVPTATL